jgi:hypothetical protein
MSTPLAITCGVVVFVLALAFVIALGRAAKDGDE